MTCDWQQLVEALREELKEYGALRSLLDDQQKAIFARDGERVNALNGALSVQIEVASGFRLAREKIMREIAQMNELPSNASLMQMKPVFPLPTQGLLKAMSSEINSMVTILRRRSRQNQMLLSRTCDMMEQNLRLLRPGGIVKTYSARGTASMQLGEPLGARFETEG